MLTLVIDTALDACSVAVFDDAGQGRLLASRSDVIGKGHAERLMGMISAVLADADIGFADLARLGVTIGPGSFTGIRVGLATARGLALATGLPLVGISTLDAIAAEAAGRAGDAPGEPILVVLDARRGEVYAGLYDGEGRPLELPCLLPIPEAVALAGRTGARLLGSGAAIVAAAAPDVAVSILGASGYPDVALLARLAARAVPEHEPPRPLYLRAPDAKPQTRGRAVLAEPVGGVA